MAIASSHQIPHHHCPPIMLANVAFSSSHSLSLIWVSMFSPSLKPNRGRTFACTHAYRRWRCFSSASQPLVAAVLGKAKDFLGVISEANERFQHDAKDLMLGVADLHTPETVAAAESAIAGYQPLIPFAANSSGTDSVDSSDNDSGDDDDDGDDENDNDDGNDKCNPLKLERSKSGQSNSLSEDVNSSKKQQKIVELS